jgi:GT2 family glycosyltransferase
MQGGSTVCWRRWSSRPPPGEATIGAVGGRVRSSSRQAAPDGDAGGARVVAAGGAGVIAASGAKASASGGTTAIAARGAVAIGAGGAKANTSGGTKTIKAGGAGTAAAGGAISAGSEQAGAAAVDTRVLSRDCLAIRRAVLRELGGFHEVYAIAGFADEDLCHKLRWAGLRCVERTDVILARLDGRADTTALWRRNLALYNSWQRDRRWPQAAAQCARPTLP